jgi:hypothetical protein
MLQTPETTLTQGVSVALVDEGQDHLALREASGGSRQAIEVAATVDVFLAAEIADDALLDPAVLADGLDQITPLVRLGIGILYIIEKDSYRPGITTARRRMCRIS